MGSLAQRLVSFFGTGTNGVTAPTPAPKDRKRPKVIHARHIDPAMIGRGVADPTHRDGIKRLTVTLDDPTFDRVRDYAVRNRVSFAAAARELIVRALPDAEERQ